MPYINTKTNLPLALQEEQAIKTQLGQAIEILPGKSEAWLMVGFQPEQALWFQGTDEPAALVEVAVYGGAPADAYDQLTARITDILCAYLPLQPGRVYVKYAETEFWGWNGSNF